MPRQLTEPEFEALKSKVLKELPADLDESSFNRIIGSKMAQAIGEAENLPAKPEGTALGRFASGAAAMLNPVPMVKAVVEAGRTPDLGGAWMPGTAAANLTKGILQGQGAEFVKAGTAAKEGRYSELLGHTAAGMLPVVGPAAASAGEQVASGDVAGGLGGGAGLLAPFGAGPAVRAARGALPTRAAAVPNPTVEFARARGVPLDAATVSDNLAVKGVQKAADRTLAGGSIARTAKAAESQAMARVGGELADQAHPVPTTPELAGTSLRDSLAVKMEGHAQQANVAYDRLRTLESPATAVDLVPVKASIQPLVDQMKRQMPITQQQANPGLKALQNILDSADSAPLSLIDKDLSAIKGLAREHGGVAKLAVSRLEAAVQKAAAAGGADVVDALTAGRQATIAKYGASDVLERLHAEPVKTIKTLTTPKDAAIQQLRAVVKEVPDQAPIIGRALLEDLLERPQAVADWHKLGPLTKAELFPAKGHIQALDQFFALKDKISKTNVNPSGSGYSALNAAELAGAGTNPLAFAGFELSAATVAKLLRSPTVVRVLTDGLRLPSSAPLTAQTAARARLVRVAAQAGVRLGDEASTLPRAATDQRPEAQVAGR